ncbi:MULTISPECIES: SDR family oxidoreductase [unclassified Bradyrhizobium]|uniref:SDR family oxidoreductase n=1 Tax=unclassified Bradyrhizobium TaxID=2631580 RepID=UPI00247A0474|nr:MULTISPECIES: SDR family oxidoreductase [unclassified Bradyrhizobium]WGR75285.1 SDR family oxidoreductase [Bradyrhizobium sp. ISRA426]WGR82787.1 SDR family oxidoreductase [Bradyrhizobium sp. ISRA430]WGR90484.1 SDR family oxidoreductase [Bradyrhizobium sp. ISRA432]
MPGEFRNRTVVITGASAGVGRAAVHRFARAGARIGLIARDEAALTDVKDEIERLGGSGFVAPADVADADQVFAAADAIARQLGPIDIWINDAMVTVFSPVWDLTPEEFRRVTDVTYLGVVHGTMAALRHMRPRNRGSIIQVGSALAFRGIPLQAAYCGAKHAIRGFTNSLRTELIHARSRIRITIVELPAVNTPQFDWARTHMKHQPRPVPPVVQPEVIADALYRAALRPAREYWVGSSTLAVVLGNMLAPGLFDRYVAGTTVSGQQTRKPVAPYRKDNLLEPIRELHRTRGSFGDESRSNAIVARGTVARIAPVVACGAALLTLGLLIRSHSRGTLRTRYN